MDTSGLSIIEVSGMCSAKVQRINIGGCNCPELP
jgi:hypothetical protein